MLMNKDNINDVYACNSDKSQVGHVHKTFTVKFSIVIEVPCGHRDQYYTVLFNCKCIPL